MPRGMVQPLRSRQTPRISPEESPALAPYILNTGIIIVIFDDKRESEPLREVVASKISDNATNPPVFFRKFQYFREIRQN